MGVRARKIVVFLFLNKKVCRQFLPRRKISHSPGKKSANVHDVTQSLVTFCKKIRLYLTKNITLQLTFQYQYIFELYNDSASETLRYSVRRLIGSLWARNKNNRMIQLTFVFCLVYIMGPAIFDYNKRLILLSVFQLSSKHCLSKCNSQKFIFIVSLQIRILFKYEYRLRPLYQSE